MTTEDTAIAPRGNLDMMLDDLAPRITEVALPGVELKRLFGLVRAAVNGDSTLRKGMASKEGRASIAQCVLQLATLGLEPTGRHGGAYLVGFNSKVSKRGEPDRWETLVQVIIDWRVYRDRAIEAGLCSDVIAEPVHEDDIFKMDRDPATGKTSVEFKYDPWLSYPKRGRRLGWLITIITDRGPLYECCQDDAIQKRRAVAKTDAAWKGWGDEMERKTAVRMAIGARLPMATRKLGDLMDLDDSASTLEVRDITPPPVKSAPRPLFSAPTPDPVPTDELVDVDEWLDWAREQGLAPERAEDILTSVCYAHDGEFMHEDFKSRVEAALGLDAP